MEYTPEQIVYPGDKIYIVQEKSIYPADRKMRDVVQEDSVALVFLEISRADGTVVRVETPLRLFSRTISSYYNNVNIITSKIRLIVERANNKRDVERIATEADGVASTINKLVHALKYDNKTSEVENIVSMSILLGQLLAKAEAATTLEPLAEAQQEFREKSRAAGIKSGKTRRQAPWRQIAQDLAIQTREKHPEWSQDKVAGEIFALWKDDQPPTHKTLKEFVSELERDGVILRRATQRKYERSLSFALLRWRMKGFRRLWERLHGPDAQTPLAIFSLDRADLARRRRTRAAMSQIPFRDRVSCTVDEACEATGLGRTTLYKLIKERRVAKKKIGRRTVLLVPTLLAEIESSSRNRSSTR